MPEQSLRDHAGIEIVFDTYVPEGRPVAVVQVLHGWAEHAGRYVDLAEALTSNGFAVYVDDHRGHGRSGERARGLGDLGPDGPDGILLATRAVTDRILVDLPGVPLVLLGHSWGAFLGQRFIRHWGRELAGAVLMGTIGRPPEQRRGAGATAPSFNARFEPARTPYDWLSRDEAEVDRYIADPYCGFERLGRPARPTGEEAPPRLLAQREERDIPPTLPVLVMNGSDDPIGGAAGGEALIAAYEAAGLMDLTLRVYPEARHELLHELNREEVTSDLLSWLKERIA